MDKYVKTELGHYFNYKLIGNAHSCKENCDLPNLGSNLFDPDTLPDSNAEIIIDDIPYAFPDKSPNKYDSISCEGQMVGMPKATYKAIHLLGLSQMGDFDEKASLIFDGHHFEEISISFIDWCFNMRWEYEKKSINFKTAISGKDAYSRICNIYQNNISIHTKQKLLTSVQLPYNPSMYLFAITLER